MSDIWLDEHEDEYLTPIYSCLKVERHWQPECYLSVSLDTLDTLVSQAITVSHSFPNTDEALNGVVDLFYGEWAFSGTNQAIAESKLNTISYALGYRTGSSFALAMILNYVLTETGFASEIVVEDGELVIHVICSDQEGYFIDPVSGHQTWYVKPENGSDPYERRDRGYLLRQLDCHNIARDDFEFFVSECPDDPATELIQHQLEEMEYQHNTLH